MAVITERVRERERNGEKMDGGRGAADGWRDEGMDGGKGATDG